MNHLEKFIEITRSLFGIKRPLRLEVKLASNRWDLQAVRQFRKSSGSNLERAGEHLFVYDHGARQVCASLRFWDPSASTSQPGEGLENCFDLTGLRIGHQDVVEIGRFYLHPDYPASMLSRMLWSAVCSEFQERKLQCMLGSVVVSTQDGGHYPAAIYRTLSRRYLTDSDVRARPLHRLPSEILYANCDPVIPPRIKEYLKLGGLLAAEPHWQPELGLAEFLFYLPANKIQIKRASAVPMRSHLNRHTAITV